jgi:hypothetical protein
MNIKSPGGTSCFPLSHVSKSAGAPARAEQFEPHSKASVVITITTFMHLALAKNHTVNQTTNEMVSTS